MPIALNTIEAKLRKSEFPTMTALEAYFKRMITNAKEFNQKGSTIYEDAERLRKALSNYMTKANPAYKLTHGFVCFPTPLPQTGVEEDDVDDEEDAEGEPDPDVVEKAPPQKKGRPAKKEASSSRQSSEAHAGPLSFVGMTFQEAQEKILADMVAHKEKPG